MKKKFITGLLLAGATFALASCGEAATPTTSTKIETTTEDKPTTSIDTRTDKEVVLDAKENSFGDESKGFDYDYTLNFAVTLKSVNKSVSGTQTGNVKYSKGSDVSYVSKRKNSGLLFYDSEVLEVLKDNTLTTVKTNEYGDVIKVDREAKTNDFKYDSSSFAKVLFEYSSDEIKEVTKSNGKYNIKTKMNASRVLDIAAPYISSYVIKKALPDKNVEVDATTSTSLTVQNDLIKSYEYSFSFDISAISVTINYTINVNKSNADIALNDNDLNKFGLGEEALNNNLNAIKTKIDAFKNQTYSAYDYKLKTGVDYDGANSIDMTVQGNTKRKVDNNEVYFNNLVEIDTDLKNADLYKSIDIADCKYNRGRLQNGSYGDWKINTLTDKGYELDSTTYDPSFDEYYLLLDSLLTTSNLNYIEYKEKDNKTTYSVALTKEGAVNVINYFNENINIDPFHENTIKALSNFELDSLYLAKYNFYVTVENNKLSEIKLDITGSFNSCYDNSRDFTQKSLADFYLNLELKVTELTTYEVPTELKGLKK